MYDVAIIGSGVIGSGIARELSRYHLRTVVVEKGSDVGIGTSKANSGIVHAGYNEKPGTLKARLNVEGQRLFDHLAQQLDFSFKRCGSLVVCFDEEGVATLENLKVQGEKNGLKGLSIIDGEGTRVLEPNLNQEVYAALFVPMGGIVSPYGMTIALAENAVENGVEFLFNYLVEHVVKQGDGSFNIKSKDHNQPKIEAKVLINAAGLFSDHINNMLSRHKIEIQPSLGEYVLLDTTEKDLVSRTIFQLPTKLGKGVLVTPTVDGNILIGPTSKAVALKDDVSTTLDGLKYVLGTGSLSVNKIKKEAIITSFAGLRAHGPGREFLIGEAKDVPGLINLCGIDSPGLSAAPAIAKEVEKLVVSLLAPTEKINFNPKRVAAPNFKKLTNGQRQALIAQDANYGKMVCRCEMVTKGEILKALRSLPQISDVDAIKRRTRLGMGRCQGGFCHMKVIEILAEELNLNLTDVTKFGGHSKFLIEENKTFL